MRDDQRLTSKHSPRQFLKKFTEKIVNQFAKQKIHLVRQAGDNEKVVRSFLENRF